MTQRASLLPCLLLTYILCCHVTDARTKQEVSLHHHMTERELQTFFGVRSRDQVPEYDIVQLFTGQDEVTESHTRHRRDLEFFTSKSYTLNGHESSIHLNLEQDNGVKSPNLVVRTYHEDGTTTESDAGHVQLYSGHVTGHPGSRVSVSERDGGLTGEIHLNREVFHVRPLPVRLAKDHGNSGAGKPHVIHRRSVRGPTKSKRKRKQTKTKHKVLEMTLEADQFAIGLHGNAVVDHILLVAHITRSLFLDDTIGPIKINLVIIGIVLKKNGFKYDKGTSVKKRLEVFSKWIDQNLPSNDTDPDHPDTAVLFTTNVIGYATIPSTCYSYYKMGRAVVGDKGLGTAVILAHETAHSLGIDHDGGKTRCPDFKHIMATKQSRGVASFTWSRCSRNDIQKFLSGPKSKCLDDAPQKSPLPNGLSKILSRLLPGELKNRTVQCQMLFGKEFINCKHTATDCELLYCEKPGSTGFYICPHKRIPPADGSTCGPRNWCIKGKCEDNGKPIIDGGWTTWSTSYSRCSRTCGGGLKWRTRECSNPKPANSGKPCQGEANGHCKLCNTQDCPPGTRDDRVSQCKALDSTYDNTHYYKDTCVLGCTKKSWGWRKGPVKDGTRCYKDAKIKDVCINGKCRVVACDGQIDSKVRRDRCGVCNGDSSACAQVTGVYANPCRGRGGNRPVCLVLIIPVGSKNIKVEKKINYYESFIGIQDKNRDYVTSYFPSISEEVDVAGTRVSFYRTRRDHRDRVTIKGPTTELLYIVNMQSYNFKNRGIDFSLLDPTKTTVVKAADFRWKRSKWTSCSKTCGKVKQYRTVECTRKDDGSYVRDHACKAVGRKPVAVRICNARACPAKWNVSRWTPCSKTCGGGIQTRKIVCHQKVADNTFKVRHGGWCRRSKPRGSVKKSCNNFACPVQWVPSKWSRCSATCGRGSMTRTLSCERRSSQGGQMDRVHPSLCANLPSPLTKQPCNQRAQCRR